MFDVARDGNDVLRTKSLRDLVRLLVVLRRENHLGLAVPVPQVDKHDAAEVTTHVNPTRQRNGCSDVLSPQFAAGVCPFLVGCQCVRPLVPDLCVNSSCEFNLLKTKMREAAAQQIFSHVEFRVVS